MINKTSLKRNIYIVCEQGNFDDKFDKLITACLLYTAVENITKTSENFSNDTTTIASSYLPTYRSLVLKAKTIYVSYSVMKKYIEKKNVYGFLEFTKEMIDEINRLYADKTEIVPFSTFLFNASMYKVQNITLEQNKRLSKIHFNVMVPIAKYFKDNYDISDDKVEIYSADSVANQPGKTIQFYISGIKPRDILSAITTGKIEISDFIYLEESRLVDEYVEIIIK